MKYFNYRIKGFTLIELLITVAIIAILAAIALPNFLEAQTRTKVTRAKADIRTISVALESYHTDNHAYPQSVLTPPELRLLPVTSPIAYLTSLPQDPFQTKNVDHHNHRKNYYYGAMPIQSASRWILDCVGPDLTPDTDPMLIEFYPGNLPGIYYGQVTDFYCMLYDPTNGTISKGDLYRSNEFTMQ